MGAAAYIDQEVQELAHKIHEPVYEYARKRILGAMTYEEFVLFGPEDDPKQFGENVLFLDEIGPLLFILGTKEDMLGRSISVSPSTDPNYETFIFELRMHNAEMDVYSLMMWDLTRSHGYIGLTYGLQKGGSIHEMGVAPRDFLLDQLKVAHEFKNQEEIPESLRLQGAEGLDAFLLQQYAAMPDLKAEQLEIFLKYFGKLESE